MSDNRPGGRRNAAAEIDILVEHWFFEAFHGSSIARSTESWNAVHAAKEELRRRLATFVAAEGAGVDD